MKGTTAMVDGFVITHREFVGYTKVLVVDPLGNEILKARLTQHQIQGLFQALSVLADPDYLKSKLTMTKL